MSVPLDAISDVLLPRRYQEEIFVRAQQGNVIAALDTGSGKTYISMLLIKHVAAQTENREKIIVFLVPKVALVQQQGEFIAKQTSLRVRQFFGATAHEMSNRDSWKKEFEAADVFVMTGILASLASATNSGSFMCSADIPQHPDSLTLEYKQGTSQPGRLLHERVTLRYCALGLIDRLRRMSPYSQESRVQRHYARILPSTVQSTAEDIWHDRITYLEP